MIKITNTSKDFTIAHVDNNNNQQIIYQNIYPNQSIKNKFNVIKDFLEDCSAILKDDFDQFMIQYLNDLKNKNPVEQEYLITHQYLPLFIKYTNQYIDKKPIEFSDYFDSKKCTKKTIAFTSQQIRELITLTGTLKFFVFLDLPMDNIIKYAIEHMLSHEVLENLFNTISAKVYKNFHSDFYMWEYIKLVCSKNVEIHVMSICNFIVHNILTVCKIDANPITFISIAVDNCIKWMLRQVYQDVVVYSDTISKADDFFQYTQSKLLNYSYSSFISDLILKSLRQFEKWGYDKEIEEKINTLIHIPTTASLISLPILSQTFNVPYKHFMLPAYHSYILNIYTANTFFTKINNRYPHIKQLLISEQTSTNSETNKFNNSLYKIKNINDIINYPYIHEFCNVSTIYPMLCMLLGNIIKFDYIPFGNKHKLKLQKKKLEQELIDFYLKFFSRKLQDDCKNLFRLYIHS